MLLTVSIYCWVVLSASRYNRTAIAKYQAANDPARPLDSLRLSALNRELVKITRIIEEAASQPAIPVQDTSAVRAPQGSAATGSGVRASSPPVSTTPSDIRPAHPEGMTPQRPPARTSGAVHADVREQLELMRSSELVARERVAAGNALVQQRDPRFRTDAWFLLDDPLPGFVEIPVGSFLMGSDQTHDLEVDETELSQHRVRLQRYFIGRYPVTVAQFRAFVEGGGPRPNSPEGFQGFANHPVMSTRWYEAQQYCNWLTERLRAWPGTIA
jgi:hypothetical protein